ncbi:MAG: hypothetical protein J6S67_01585 [Methanobrevibacter sp.]|nr:hypothetical protein [Methanobrevibacter sp.]
MATEKLNTIKFYCQKVLPLVYDDSLSYYEVLCKVVKYLNDTIEYVNNLDVEEYVTNELNEMAEDGRLAKIIADAAFDFVTPEMYGAVGDGETDDTKAVEDAFNSGMPVKLMKNKHYRITRTITMIDNRVFRLVYCDAATPVSNRVNIIIDIPSGDSQIGFNVLEESVYFENVEFQCINTSRQSCTYFLCHRTAADIDISFNNCCFREGARICDFYGRGFKFFNCKVAHTSQLLNIHWEGESDTIYHDDETGQRAIIITNNRFHSINHAPHHGIINVESGNCFGMTFNDNVIDRDFGFLLNAASKLKNVSFLNNVLNGPRPVSGSSYNPMVRLVGGAEGFQFKNNTIFTHGNTFAVGCMVAFTGGDAINCNISGNYIDRLIDNHTLIVFHGDTNKNNVISNNIVGKMEDVTSYGCILRNYNGLENTVLTGNIIGDASYVDDTYSCKTLVIGNQQTIKNCRMFGNV